MTRDRCKPFSLAVLRLQDIPPTLGSIEDDLDALASKVTQSGDNPPIQMQELQEARELERFVFLHACFCCRVFVSHGLICTACDNVPATQPQVPILHCEDPVFADLVLPRLPGSAGMVPCGLAANVDSFRRNHETDGMAYLGYENDLVAAIPKRTRSKILVFHFFVV